MYSLIGKAVVRLGISYARRRYGRQAGIGAAVVAIAVAIAVYLANREVPEG